MNLFKRIAIAAKNFIYINSTTHEVYMAKERIATLTSELNSYKTQLQEYKKELSHYQQIHNNTQHTMYHFVQKQLLAQSLLFQTKLEKTQQPKIQNNINQLPKEYLDSYYLAFENRFRGSRDSILKRYQAYYDFIPTTPKNALDIGCGRGEWLQILQAKNIQAHGVDLNTPMLDLAKQNNVQNLHNQDALEFLQNTPANSYDLITAFHIIEHIPFNQLIPLLNEIKRVATKDATILLETPNPANLQVAANHFYTDPTHLNPLPHRVMEFMLEYLGYKNIKTHHLNPYPQNQHLSTNTPEARVLNHHLHSAQDYLLTAQA